MKDFQLGKFTVDDKSPVVIIAELACEHGGDMNTAKRLIRAAKVAGADVAKLQLHVIEDEMLPNIIKFWAGSMDEVLRRVNIGTLEQHKELKLYCEELGIMYLCTPFCMAAADMLEKVGVDAYKIGSGELTNIPMIRHIAQKRKPILVSTGMSTINEIIETVDVLHQEKAKFALMHCVSEYPAKYEDLNLKMIDVLKDKFGCVTGFSDHTDEIYSAIAAVSLGAKIIEKHFTIRELQGPDNNVSLDPKQFEQMVDAIRKVETSLGASKFVHEEEKSIREWAHHSIISKVDIPLGTMIASEMLTVKRPGNGISAKHLGEFINKKVKKNIIANTLLSWDDIN